MNFGGREEGDKDYRTPANRQELGSVLRYLFNLSGKRLAPPELDVDTIKTVIDVSGGGFLNYEIQSVVNNISIAAASNTNFNILDANNAPSTVLIGSTKPRNSMTDVAYTAVTGQTFIGNVLQWDARLQTLNFSLLFDAAGSIAFSGKYISIFLKLVIPPAVAAIDIWNGKAAFSVASGRTSYNGSLLNGFIALPNQGNGLQGLGGWNRFIPYGCSLTFTIQSDDGTSFPANTTCSIDTMAVMTPKGVQLPW